MTTSIPKNEAQTETCQNCRYATSVGYRGTSIGYYICANQRPWEYRAGTSQCNIGKHWPRPPAAK